MSNISVLKSFFTWLRGNSCPLILRKRRETSTPWSETHFHLLARSEFHVRFASMITHVGLSGRLEEGRDRRVSAEGPASSDRNQAAEGRRCEAFFLVVTIHALVFNGWLQVLPGDTIRLECVTQTGHHILCTENTVTSK